MDPRRRAELLSGLPRTSVEFFGDVAFACATESVNLRMPEMLAGGVTAVIFFSERSDWRDGLIYMSLLNHSAWKLGVNLDQCYLQVRPLASHTTGIIFDEWFFEGGARDIRQMGYEEVIRPDGHLTYQPVPLPRRQPPRAAPSPPPLPPRDPAGK